MDVHLILLHVLLSLSPCSDHISDVAPSPIVLNRLVDVTILREAENYLVLKLLIKKIASGFKDGTSTSVKEAINSVDAILHALGRGTLKIWLRMLVRDLQGGEPDLVTARRKAEQDLE